MTTAQPHPIEDFLNLEPGSTQKALNNHDFSESASKSTALVATELPQPEELEVEERAEDLQVDSQLSEIHTAAMQAFYQQAALAQQVDPKFSARNAEVAAQFLTAALNTVNSRVDAKFKRQKIRLERKKLTDGVPNSVQNNLIVTDRNSLMKSLFADMQGVAEIAKGSLPNEA